MKGVSLLEKLYHLKPEHYKLLVCGPRIYLWFFLHLFSSSSSKFPNTWNKWSLKSGNQLFRFQMIFFTFWYWILLQKFLFWWGRLKQLLILILEATYVNPSWNCHQEQTISLEVLQPPHIMAIKWSRSRQLTTSAMNRIIYSQDWTIN